MISCSEMDKKEYDNFTPTNKKLKYYSSGTEACAEDARICWEIYKGKSGVFTPTDNEKKYIYDYLSIYAK